MFVAQTIDLDGPVLRIIVAPQLYVDFLHSDSRSCNFEDRPISFSIVVEHSSPGITRSSRGHAWFIRQGDAANVHWYHTTSFALAAPSRAA
jgi:hypothetical protein